MNDRKSDPPLRAMWLLERLYTATDKEALAGDLIEKFHEGESARWFWRQVLIAIALGVLIGVRRHWPQICFAAAGIVMGTLFGRTFHAARTVVPWSSLPWPWSMLLFDCTAYALLSLAALPVLATALLINGNFRWASLVRTWLISLPLLAAHHYAMAEGWRAVRAGGGETAAVLLAWLGLLFWFSMFLTSACPGCVRVHRSGIPTGAGS